MQIPATSPPPWPPAEMPPESPTRKYKPDSKTAPASTCLRRRRKSRRAGGLAIVDVPPAYRIRSFCTTLPPPPAIVHPWPRQRRQCGIPAVIRFDVVIVVVVVVALTYYVVAIATCLDAPSPLSLRRRLSLSMPRRLSRASIATPTPVSLHHYRASGWLLHRHLSCRAVASLVAPSPLSLEPLGLLGGSSSINPMSKSISSLFLKKPRRSSSRGRDLSLVFFCT